MLLLTINGRIIIIINMYKKRINMNIVRTLKTIFKGVAFMLKEEYPTHYCGKLSFTAIMGASVFGFLIKKLLYICTGVCSICSVNLYYPLLFRDK